MTTRPARPERPLTESGILIALGTAAARAGATTPCEEPKAALAAKLDARGVENYTLDAGANDQVADQTVIGRCEGGTKKFVYRRGGAAGS